MPTLAIGSGAVVVTGASTGIGKACAIHLETLGHLVFAGYRKEADAEVLRAEGGDRLIPIRLDVTSAEDIAAAVAFVDERLGDAPLLSVINNAGIGLGGPLEYLPLEDLRWQFEVNVVGLLAVTQAFLPAMRRGTGGRIINVGSIGGRVTTPFMGPYCASKYAVEAITDAFRGELKPWGIQAIVIEPGMIETPIWDKAQEAAAGALDTFPAIAQERYGAAFQKLSDFFSKAPGKAAPVSQVADAVEHAVTSRHPKTRYLVGNDAHMGAFFRWLLPDRAMDWLMANGQG